MFEKCIDMDGNQINIGDKILVATKDGHIRRATVTSLRGYGWVYYTMDLSRRESSSANDKVVKISSIIEGGASND